MGEEEKKAEEKKVEEEKVEEKPKKVEEGEKKEEAKEEKEKSNTNKAKVEETPKEPPPPPPPQEIVLRVYMHCEGCARKVRKCLKGFQGVENVMTDCETHKVVVKGDKADPLKVLARVQRKSHRQVELLFPIPAPSAEPKKAEQKEIPKPPEKEEPRVIIVVLKVHMHCEACAQEVKKRIERMKGVEIADPDLEGSQVTVKGVFDPLSLVGHVYKKTGKHATVIKQEPEKKKEEDKGTNEAPEEKKDGEGGIKEGGKNEELAAPSAPEDGKEKKEEGGEKEAAKPEGVAAAATGEKEKKTEVMELIKKNEFFYYFPPQNYQINPPRVAYPYPPAPQMFSDENPNACSVM